MNNYFKSTARTVLGLAFLSTLYACDNNDNGIANSSSSLAQTEVPADVQKLTLGTGTLSAFVTIDGGSPIAMTIDPTGTGSASATIPGLTLASHTVTITYEFDDGVGILVVATATNTVDLTAGDGSISFVEADYDLASHDADGDGISNAAELAAGTDPRVDEGAAGGPCVLGTSTLGNCTL